jgi:hypothetical protein
MSRGTPDTGDNNPVAAGRIARAMLLMFLAVVVVWVLARLAGTGPTIADMAKAMANLAGLSGRGGDRDGAGDAEDGAAGGGGSGPARGIGGRGRGKIGGQVKRVFAANGGPATVAQAQAAVTALVRMQEMIERLPEAERAQARAERDKLASELFEARLKAYLAASPAQKQAELDRQIRQDGLMRRAWQVSRKRAGGSGPGEGFPGDGGGWPGEGGAGATEDEQNRHLKNFLDNTSPEQRARYEEYRRAMEARRQQMRLPP